MFPNLRAEMARKNITIRDIEEKLNKSNYWLQNRLQGKTRIGWLECKQIQLLFFPDLTVDYLFETEETQALRRKSSA